MITWSEIFTIVRTVLRWWWVIVIAVALASGSAYYISKRTEQQFYVAKATLMVGNTFEAVRPQESQMALATALARYYNEMVRREPTLRPVQENLKLPFPWQYINDRMLYTNMVANATLLEVQITDTNPERAAQIANSIGEQLIDSSPASPEKVREQQQAIEVQLNDSYTKAEALRKQVAELSAQRLKVASASEATEINEKLTQMTASLDDEQKIYRELLDLQNQSTVNTLRFIERAAPPTTPLPSKRTVAVGSAGAAGLALALVAIFLLDRFDTRWRGPRDVRERLRMRVLGTLPAGAPLLQAAGEEAAAREQAVRVAHLNLLLALGEGGCHTLLVSSVRAHEQRAAFALDLACLFARSGHQVLLVGIDQASALLGQVLPPDTPAALARPSRGRFDLRAALLPTQVPNLHLLPLWPQDPDGPPPVPTLRLPELVPQIEALADVVIFDGPSTLDDAGAVLLAPKTDGVVLLLASENRRGEVTLSRERLLGQPETRILGAVLLTPPRRRGRLLPGRKAKSAVALPSTPAPTMPSMAGAAAPAPAPEPADAPAEAAGEPAEAPQARAVGPQRPRIGRVRRRTSGSDDQQDTREQTA
jgi:capsular polysaccharide biosynthesis protein